jgi:hypothetical protein
MLSDGHTLEEPLQYSAGSHAPVDARHSVPTATKATATQTGLPLLQSTSPISHRFPVEHAAPGMQGAQVPAPSQSPPVQ